MPAGRRSQCEACYWKGLLEKRVAICQAGLGDGLAGEFGAFGRWLEQRQGSRVAAIRINRYLALFQAMDAEWGRIPDYKALVARFHAEGLRRTRLAIRWMEESGRLVVDESARKEDSERQRIRRMKEEIDASTAGGALWHAFRERLTERGEEREISLRSVRLALSAAADLVRRMEGRVPDQPGLDTYLLDKPGQKANISGFVNFINAENGSSLATWSDERRAMERRKVRLERRLIAMMKSPEDSPEFRRKWARLAMKYFHGQPMPKTAELLDSQDEGLVVRSGEEEYWIPLPLRTMRPDSNCVFEIG